MGEGYLPGRLHRGRRRQSIRCFQLESRFRCLCLGPGGTGCWYGDGRHNAHGSVARGRRLWPELGGRHTYVTPMEWPLANMEACGLSMEIISERARQFWPPVA
ncbi:hypothetical protein LZ30DRAFT_80289 [Colletotrichum cereale]|nr:hypothetical protein LZ30DRAFT_80289 [Colletotrichum cereale]